ncbi:MAG: F0F1 ATP synthase subunit alpha [Clostridia bacterium]|nr:F0F1 ATP synthase subunit alpha [Clostridia bacterium]MDQ7790741.1 F0F1 ATP synthase subunit alpha [Clostridia bacterium]
MLTSLKLDEISALIRHQIEQYEAQVEVDEVGTVVRVGDGVAQVHGLRRVMLAELVEFPDGVLGMALNLEQEQTGCVILGEYHPIHEGDTVRRTGRIASVPVGQQLVGRVLNPIGLPLDGQGSLNVEQYRAVEHFAPAVTARAPVSRPLQTGIKAVDALVPIGRGQRQLILGDRQTGKTAIAVDAIINQRDKNVFCVYVAIGQKASTIARVVQKLREENALAHTVVIAATAAEPAALLFIAPFAGTAVAEELMEQGHDVLIVYDDLSRHAVAYREISLLLRRPPGREAFPGDIFYLHARLLERAAQLDHISGGGSITALPIIETQQGDISAYIPTNVISITDGQIYLESDFFYAGVRPAINVGLSVSRVGGSAQTKVMRQVAGQLRLDLARYRELAAFARFGADLDRGTQNRLTRGARLVELLKQKQYRPLSLDEMVVSLYTGVQGYLDDIPVELVDRFQTRLHKVIGQEQPGLGERIRETGDLTKTDEQTLCRIIEELLVRFRIEQGIAAGEEGERVSQA